VQRIGRDQVVAALDREFEKLLGHFRAHHVQPNIALSRAAQSIAIEARQRRSAARFEFGAQDIFRASQGNSPVPSELLVVILCRRDPIVKPVLAPMHKDRNHRWTRLGMLVG
jgi:hypothetical protein